MADDAVSPAGAWWHHVRPGQAEGRALVKSRTYEVAFAGEAGAVLRAEFDDCGVTVAHGTTVLRAELPDPAALAGLMQRIAALRLEIVHVHLVAAQPDRRAEAEQQAEC
jgi:hypothetical protein